MSHVQKGFIYCCFKFEVRWSVLQSTFCTFIAKHVLHSVLLNFLNNFSTFFILRSFCVGNYYLRTVKHFFSSVVIPNELFLDTLTFVIIFLHTPVLKIVFYKGYNFFFQTYIQVFQNCSEQKRTQLQKTLAHLLVKLTKNVSTIIKQISFFLHCCHLFQGLS